VRAIRRLAGAPFAEPVKRRRVALLEPVEMIERQPDLTPPCLPQPARFELRTQRGHARSSLAQRGNGGIERGRIRSGQRATYLLLRRQRLRGSKRDQTRAEAVVLSQQR